MPKWSAELNTKRAVFIGGALDDFRLESKLYHAVDQVAVAPRHRQARRRDGSGADPDSSPPSANGSAGHATPSGPQTVTGVASSGASSSSAAASRKDSRIRISCILCSKRAATCCVLCGVPLCTGKGKSCFDDFHRKSAVDLGWTPPSAAASSANAAGSVSTGTQLDFGGEEDD